MIKNVCQNPELQKIALRLKTREQAQAVIMEAARPCTIAALALLNHLPLAVIAPTPQRAVRLKEETDFWLGRDACIILPENEALPYQRIPENRLNTQERIEVLARLVSYSSSTAPPVIILTARTLAFKTVEYGKFADSWISLNKGQQADPLIIVKHLLKTGYNNEGTVTAPGEISRRGGILDIFPVGREKPVRIDFYGNEIDEIREFDPSTQRSTAPIEEAVVCPGSEIGAALLLPGDEIKNRLSRLNLEDLEKELKTELSADIEKLAGGEYSAHAHFYGPLFFEETILNYLPADCRLIFDDAGSIQWAVSNIKSEEAKTRQGFSESGLIPGGMPSIYFSWEEIEARVNQIPSLYLYSWEPENGNGLLNPQYGPVEKFGGSYNRFRSEIAKLAGEKKSLAVVSFQAERIAEILKEVGIPCSLEPERSKPVSPGEVAVFKGIVDGGWSLDGKYYLYSDSEIQGFARQNRQVARKPGRHTISLDRIKPGDFVVHIDHGIARFGGITSMETSGSPREFLVLEYSHQDRLYVPVDQVDRVSRYIGSGDAVPPLNRLGTEQWQNTRKKALEAAQEIASELLELYSRREIVNGFSFSGDSVWQKELEASFPYVETADQISALEQIKKDMVRPRPMDRLLLGDVGYGKTEVALRAAFKAVQDNMQVAVLVPTTLLAQQHYITFSQRLGAYPVAIESISRFKMPAEQKNILKRLKEGSLDIIIGTHRLLQRDVIFKNLGLIIIDEEQRFGVKHKELLKRKRAEVDVLAMSATPIPRTLYMSLTGVRDMSTIETPPDERLPVHTMVARFNPQLVREAIMREIERNGQVFFVHNRVRSIDEMSQKLKQIVPEARFSVAHGQMDEEGLAQVMMDFTEGKVDVLVCTTIIESGLDLPNANTLIVNRADKFGLIQLHQLRGRVGRGTAAGYAYFVYDDEKKLTEDGRRRLRTIYELAELGSGFNIAMKDLEIRGAGTLLGTHQSGHIAAVGFNMYTELLSKAIEEEKARRSGVSIKREKKLPEPVIDLPLIALIPEEYVKNDDERLYLYRRLAGIGSLESLDDFVSELVDRFGTLPEEAANLIYGAGLKIMAKDCGISLINAEKDNIIILPYEGLRIDTGSIAMRGVDGIRLSPYRIQMDMKKTGAKWRQLLESLLREGISLL